MQSLQEKCFVLGIGAQKAGTTWLYDYLDNHSQVLMSPLKEMHYFDNRFRSDLCGMFDRQNRKRLDELEAQFSALDRPLNDSERGRLDARRDRANMVDDPDFYRQHFEKRIRDEHRVFGEVTPSYALIRNEGFRHIRNLFPERKIVFLLRDPVDRFWSGLKQFQSGIQNPNILYDATEKFYDELTNPFHVERTRYEETLEVLDDVYDPSEVLVLFYEHLFSNESVEELCKFLMIDFIPGNYDRRVNTSSIESRLDSDMEQAALNTFENTYRYIIERYGDRVPSRWTERANRLSAAESERSPS